MEADRSLWYFWHLLAKLIGCPESLRIGLHTSLILFQQLFKCSLNVLDLLLKLLIKYGDLCCLGPELSKRGFFTEIHRCK